MSCCRRLCSEFKHPMFSLDDPPKGKLDMNAHFHIGQGLRSWVGAFKLLTFLIAIAVEVYAFYRYPSPSFYAAYLTPWGVFFCILYLGGSFWLTVFGFADNSNQEQATRLVKFTWFFYSVAAVLGCCIAALYWFFVYTPSRGIELNNVMTHGGLLLIVLLQNYTVDRVPLRIKHSSGSEVIAIIYMSWLAIHNTLVKYNPLDDDDDDAIYDAVKWRENPTGATILTCIVLLGAIPLFTILLWALSLCGRRYLDEKSNTQNELEGGDGLA